jgi:hypothetical protein
MAQQSAVEWLFMTLALTPMTDWYNVLEQAKSMEKEQITQAHLFGLLRPIQMEATNQAEEYYNETYNK